MTKLTAFLGLLMCLFLVAGCATHQSSVATTPVPQEQMLVLDVETFIVEGAHSDADGTNESAVHELTVGFFHTEEGLFEVIKCEHGVNVIKGDDAAEMYRQLRTRKAAKVKKADL